ncbi:hypothetical protein ACH5RR_001618 [Cinchona calisaya]|uniref:Uncharacterized protein n=1 Tax=Cinchona calisaya TaxID=153742 RepID=A0ABD3B3X0_9GENT
MLAKKEEHEIPTTSATATTQGVNKYETTTTSSTCTTTIDESIFVDEFDIDSTCSTPYVSAPSSPGRGGEGGGGAPISGFYYSAPASPMHFITSTSTSKSNGINPDYEISSSPSSPCSFEFDFASSKFPSNGASSGGGSMSSADELFLNGQIRPMKLSTHLQRPQALAPLLDLDEGDDDNVEEMVRGRDAKMRDRSLRRRTRSMSPLRSTPFGWDGDSPFAIEEGLDDKKKLGATKNGKGVEVEGEEAANASGETTPCESGASSRSSSVGRSSSRWIFLKEFLYRSKSEGRNNGHKFWGSLSFSPVKEKMKMEKFMASKIATNFVKNPDLQASSSSEEGKRVNKEVKKKVAVNGVGKRRVPPSPHELHYTANRAQAEEMRKKTFLPYKQGLLGCLGFTSKSYGAMNGFARALNPVSSR